MINKVGAKQALQVASKDTASLKADTGYVIIYDTISTPEAAERLRMQNDAKIKAKMQNDANRIVSNMYKAIDGLGTDDALFEKTLSEINESNVYYVNDIWDKTFGKHCGETFYESFMNDADSKQKATFSEKLKALFKKFLHQEK
ncbi:hypothetical protein J6A31_02835 [bacterium]|nr:hypothetical protein [bacterium]